MTHTPYPQRIAICGNPGSGKTTAAGLIADTYGYTVADDGKALREIAINYLGLTHEQVYTQEGKLEYVMLNGRRWQVREVLGEIGNAFEEKFGADIIPIMADNAQPAGQFSVFASVRREQGRYWKEKGALVLEIVNPEAGPGYAFDRYNPAYADHQILNDGPARGLSEKEARQDLANKLVAVIGPVY